jgi:hypothetical protein
MSLPPAENRVTSAVYLQRILDIRRKSFVSSIHRQRGNFTNIPLSDTGPFPVEVQMHELQEDKAAMAGTSRGLRIIGPSRGCK